VKPRQPGSAIDRTPSLLKTAILMARHGANSGRTSAGSGRWDQHYGACDASSVGILPL